MRFLFTILTIIFLVPAFGQTNEKISLTSESGLYVSGDLIRMQLIVQDASGSPVSPDRIVHTFLIDNSGSIVLKRKFLITDLDKAGFIYLPQDLKTGNYKLVACMAGSTSRTELILPVYNPSIFASSIPPSNANTQKSISFQLPETAMETNASGDISIAELTSLTVQLPESAGSGVMLSKIYDPRYDTPPVTGKVISDDVPEAIEDKLKFDYISTDPNSRISLYFLEQGFVEEFYLAEEDKILEKLPAMFGSGHVYAYQFDAQGNRLGELPVLVERASQISFSSFDNTVPFDTKVRDILEKKRIRKFVDQIYRTGEPPVVSLMAEEYNSDPDRVVLLKNYGGVATLREALANITPKTQVIRRDKSYELRLAPENSGFRYPESPLILIDGVPIYSLDSLMEMPSSAVESIEVYVSLQNLRRFGTFGRYGVISINMKDSEDNPLQEKFDSIPVYYGVSDLVSDNTVPDGPDLRPVAYWNPALRNNNQREVSIRWRPSDVSGEYQVWSSYLDQNGQRTMSAIKIDVTPN